jgi:hypothetical protein
VVEEVVSHDVISLKSLRFGLRLNGERIFRKSDAVLIVLRWLVSDYRRHLC